MNRIKMVKNNCKILNYILNYIPGIYPDTLLTNRGGVTMRQVLIKITKKD